MEVIAIAEHLIESAPRRSAFSPDAVARETEKHFFAIRYVYFSSCSRYVFVNVKKLSSGSFFSKLLCFNIVIPLQKRAAFALLQLVLLTLLLQHQPPPFHPPPCLTPRATSLWSM